MPVPHGDDVQVYSDMIFNVEKLRELSDGQRVAHRQRIVRDEAGLVRVEHRAFDNFSAQQVRPVEHVESDLSFRGLFHAIRHRRRVGVKPHARVLNVEDKRVNSLEHFIGRTPRFAIETVNGKARGGILGGSNFFITAPGEAVLRAE